MRQEVWKDIPGYEGRYQASTMGRIRSVEREYFRTDCIGRKATVRIKGRILKPGRFNSYGHLSVALGAGQNGMPVHQLILLTFVGNAPEGMEVRHLNGNPTDNRLSNLAYGTRSDNIQDVFRQGRTWGKLTMDEVREIRRLLKMGYSQRSIASTFNVSQRTICRINRGESYSCVP